jgi:cell division protease FtsH
MFWLILCFVEIFNSFRNKVSNILKIDRFCNLNTTQSINKLMRSKKIIKIWINEDENEEIISQDNLNNYHFTKNGLGDRISRVINKCIGNNIKINFISSIKPDNIFKTIYDDINFLISKIFIPIIWMLLIFNLLSISINMIESNNHEANNFLKNSRPNKINKINQPLQNNSNTNYNSIYKEHFNEYQNILHKENISLSSWVGSQEVFEECWEVISYVKNYSNYKRLGAELPKGILLEGPPGVGKTLLAKAIATETNSTFISVGGSEFIEMYVGVGASRVRELFSLARLYSPSIIFIDEIDAIGKHRSNGFGGGGGGGGHSEHDQTLNQLLTEMDGFGDNTGILVLGATNRKDMLDKALVRPGRFDRVITIGLPDRYSRLEILKLYLGNKKHIDKNINTNTLADLTDGYSGADLKNLVNEAAILAARRGATQIKDADLSNALEKSIIGLVKNNDDRSPETLLRVSVHEVGHAFIAIYYKDYFDLQKISIKSTYSGAGGYTMFTEKPKYKNDGLYTKELLFKRLVISMGGKAAETIWYGGEQVSSGATQDLKQSNRLARKMIGMFGMGDSLETFYNQEVDSLQDYNIGKSAYSDKTKELFDLETMEIVKMAYLEAKKIIIENKDECTDIIELLVDKKVLVQTDLKKYFE